MPICNTTKAYRECVAVKAVQAKHRTSLSTSRDNQTNMSKVLDLFTINIQTNTTAATILHKLIGRKLQLFKFCWRFHVNNQWCS